MNNRRGESGFLRTVLRGTGNGTGLVTGSDGISWSGPVVKAG